MLRIGFLYTWLVVGILFAAGCAKHYNVEGFESYVDAFVQSAGNHGKDLEIDELVIVFGTPASASADATCYQGVGAPKVVIDKTKWEQMGESKRTALIFHELGHCLLDRDHKSGTRADSGCPNSLMNTYTISDFCFSNYRSEYESELFI